jgi:hypothetical protein
MIFFMYMIFLAYMIFLDRVHDLLPTDIRGVLGTLFLIRRCGVGRQVASGEMTTRQGVGVVSVVVLGAIVCTCGPVVWIPALRYT